MTRHFGQRAIERAAVILRVGERYSNELDVAGREVHSAIEGRLVWTLPTGEGLGRSIQCFLS